MKKILVPIDFSETSEAALEVAVQITKTVKGHLHIIHMVNMPHYAYGSNETPASIFLLKATKKKMDELLHKPFLKEVEHSSEILYDDFLDGLEDKAKEYQANLIVIGTHGTAGFKEDMIGSNTEKVIRHADMPVLAIKHKHKNFNPKNVVFASNFDSEVDSVFSQIKEFAEIFGAHLNLVKIITPNYFENTTTSMKSMNDFAAKHQLQNFSCHIFNEMDVEDGILNFSREINADLITMTTHGRTGLARVLNGSIAESVSNHSILPVVSVKVIENKKNRNSFFPNIP